MSRTVLIVDDEPRIRSLVALILRNVGYGVLEAVNGEDALGMLRDNRVSLIITDYCMPGMNGFQFIRRLRKIPEYKTVPVILISGSSELILKEFIDEDISEFLMKPFIPKRLLDVVDSLMNTEDLQAFDRKEVLYGKEQTSRII